MFEDDVQIEEDEIPESFAAHFERKILGLSAGVLMNPNVYNGRNKFVGDVANVNFMTAANIKRAVLTIKMKNLEGDDRIPKRILIDGIEILLASLASFFKNV